MKCSLCPQRCNAQRSKEGGFGICKAGTTPIVARVSPHYWEEPCISGTKGSGAVFFSGCTLKCVFCQNFEISALNKGKAVTEQQLADYYKELEQRGVHNINLVSADQFAPAIAKSLDIYKPSVPVIYNCSGYQSKEILRILDGYIDVYLPDFKYSDNTLAMNYSKAENYTDVAISAVTEMIRQTKNLDFDNDGIIRSGVIVRHLILPNHTKNSIGVLDILNEHFGDNILVSLMGQYIPHGEAVHIEKLNRKITKREYDKVFNHLSTLGLDGFAQELESADEKYIPDWDLNMC